MEFLPSTDFDIHTGKNHVVFSPKLKDGHEDSDSQKDDDCHTYRYELKRIWGDGKVLCFIMYNPSTSTENYSDWTTTHCETIAREWGYNGIALYNLYAKRSSDPSKIEELLQRGKEAEAIGPHNIEILEQVFNCDQYDKIVCAWGNRPCTDEVLKEVLQEDHLGKICVFRTTAKNQPHHPRGIPNDISMSDSYQETERYVKVMKKRYKFN